MVLQQVLLWKLGQCIPYLQMLTVRLPFSRSYSGRGSLDDGRRTCLGKLGIDHALKLQVMLHLRLNQLFKLIDAIILNPTILFSLPL